MRPITPLMLIFVTLLSLLLVRPAGAAQPGNDSPPDLPKVHADPVPFLSAEDAIKAMKLPPGLRVEVVATEPLIEHPVAMSFDPDGRLWVVEMRSYMPDVDGKGEDAPTGRVSVLEDTDGDGRMDKSSVFFDNLVLPRAIACVRGGALVAVPPKLLFCRDTDGDGKADEQTVVATDYGVSGNPEHMPNGLMTALDNWIYSANYGKRFRFISGSWIGEAVPEVGQWGITQNDFGRLFHNNNSDYLRASPLPVPYVDRNPFYRASGGNEKVAENQLCYPSHKTAFNRGYLDGMVQPDGRLKRFTAACGPLIYRGKLLGPEYEGNAFVCEPSANFIRRAIVTENPDGTLTSRNAYDRDEFLTSTYERFRPVNLYTGPDGAIYVLDMHHGLLQHKIYLTAYAKDLYLQKQLDRHLNTGRIYRIVPDHGPAPAAATNKLSDAKVADLIALLGDRNGQVRDTAQRLIIERNDFKAIPLLRTLARTTENPITRLHALWTLEGFRVSDPTVILPALSDANPKVRAAAIRLCEPLLASESARPKALAALMTLAGDESPDVRIQFALTMSAQANPEVDALLAKMLVEDGRYAYLRDAVVSGLRGRELGFLERLLRDPDFTRREPSRAALLTALAKCVVAEAKPDRVERLLDRIAREPFATETMRVAVPATAPATAPATRSAATTKRLASSKSAASTTPATTRYATTRTSRGSWRAAAMLEGFPPPVAKGRRPPRAILTASEPAALAKLRSAAVAPPASDQLARVMAVVHWPGQAGYVPPPPPKPLTPAEQARFEAGRAVYAKTCAQCHKPTGLGQEGLAPPLLDSEWALGPESRVVRIVLHGLQGPITVGDRTYSYEMPGLGVLTDDEIAAVLTYVRREWDHDADPVTPETVARIRQQVGPRATPWTERDLLRVE
jgi:mono/diheme cytochrome c family protein